MQRQIARRLPLALAFLLGPATGLLAQSHRLSFAHLSLAHGLSQATAYAVLQDHRGFLWIATQDGLNRYDGYDFDVYQQDDEDPESLRSNTVFALHEDSGGTLWVGTWEGGLHRYERDGDGFTALRSDPADPHGLGAATVRAIRRDRGGRLWVGTEGDGLYRLDSVPRRTSPGRATGVFTRFVLDPDAPDPESPRGGTALAIHEDRAGTLWIGTEGGGLHRLDGASETFTVYRHDPDDPMSLGHDSVAAIEEDTAGRLWLGTWGGGLSRFDPASGSFTHYRHDPDDPTSLSGHQVFTLHEEREGVLWVGTSDAGLNRLDVESGVFRHYRHDPSDARSLSSDQVISIYQDPTGTLWFGTGGAGVDRLDFNAQKFAHYRHDPDEPASLGNDSVLSLFEDSAGRLWVGTYQGGLDRLDRQTGDFTHFRHDPADPHSLANDTVYALLEDAAGDLWIGTSGGGLNRFEGAASGRATGKFIAYRHDPEDPASLSEDQIASLYEDSGGTLWIGTWDAGLNRLDAAGTGGAATGRNASGGDRVAFTRYRHDEDDPASLSGDRIYAICEDREGVLWVSAEGHGLNALDRATGASTHYRHDESDPTSLGNNSVMDIHEDRAGTLWIGTYGGGLDRFERASRTFRHHRERDGLPNNVVYGILEDSLGRLWLSTNRGLSRFDPRAGTFRNYDIHDGLQDQEFNSGAFHRGRRGVFYFGGGRGFNAFFPERVHDNPYVPPVVLTSFKKFNEGVLLGKAVSEVEAITLGPQDSVVSFEFSALSYTAPQKNRYAYQLEGFNDQWTDLGTKRDITFTNLNPGSYVFRVKGSNNDGVWNEEGLAVDLTVLPPYWATWWFRTLTALSLALAVVAGHQLRTRSVRARNQQLEAMNQQLEAMNLELEAKNAQLERFTYTVSHDLKSPLVTIKGFLGFLERDALAGDHDRVKHDAARIASATDKMARLLNELLELSRIGRVMNTPEPVSLNEVAREAAGLVSGPIEARRVTLEIAADMPGVVADRVRLLEVFQNLIDNAVSFMGDQREPRIEVGAKERGEEVLCWVRDNGIGIEARYRAKIFELFERLNPETEGTGVGLALVERIVEVHGGRVWVESEGKGRGSTFCFTLPWSRPQADAASRTPRSRS